MGKSIFIKRSEEKINQVIYSNKIIEICKFYKLVSSIGFIIVIFSLIEPAILFPTFIISLLMFLSKKMRISWRVSTFIEKIQNGQLKEAEEILNKIDGTLESDVNDELKNIYEEWEIKLKK